MNWALSAWKRLENRLLAAFGALALCMLSLLGLSGRAYNELLAAQAWQTHTQAVLTHVNQLEATLDEDRGLLYCSLTGDRSGLPATERSARLRPAREEIQRLVQDNTGQLERLTLLDHLLRDWQRNVSSSLRGWCDEASRGHRRQPADVAPLAVLSRDYRDRLSALLGDMARQEHALLRQREQRAQAAQRDASRLFMAAAVVTVLLAGAAMLMLRKSVKGLHESERQLRAMLERLPDGVLAFDGTGRIAWLNPAAEAMLGLDFPQARGQSITRFVPELDKALQSGEDIGNWLEKRRQLDGRRINGAAFPLELTTNPLLLEAQPLVVCIARDLSEQQHMDRMKREFVSVVSHELRTPLTGLRGSISLLADGTLGELPAPARRMVEIADQTSDRLVTLVNDILDLERAASGQLSIRMRTVDMAQAARDAIAAAEGLATRHGVRLDLVQAPGNALLVIADDHRLAQVLANLLSNAIKFSPQDGVVSLRAMTSRYSGRIEVVDQGPGIPADFREHVFERFAQADATNTRQRGGSGLGLSISKALMERMEGRIGFESPPFGQTQGSLFWVELRLLNAPAAALPSRSK